MKNILKLKLNAFKSSLILYYFDLRVWTVFLSSAKTNYCLKVIYGIHFDIYFNYQNVSYQHTSKFLLHFATFYCALHQESCSTLQKNKKKSLFPKQGVRIHSFFFSGTTTYQINLRVLFTHMYGSADMKSNCLL